MIGYVWPNDVAALAKAKNRRQVSCAVEAIVHRMPAPRTFVATPTLRSAAAIPIDQSVFYELVEKLIEEGVSVIDPSLVANLLTYNKSWRAHPRDEQMLFLHLASAGLVSSLWLPVNWRENVRLIMMCGTARARHLHIKHYAVPD